MPCLKFCPQCGYKLEINLKFCPNCGFNLSSLSSITETVQSENIESASVLEVECENAVRDEELDQFDCFTPKIDIQLLGRNFENVLEQIYTAEGFVTQKRQKIPGKCGYTNEIDIIAIKNNDKIAIECKNYLSPVGIDKIRDFSEKVRDLGIQWRGVFASYTTFTRDAVEFAKDRHIELLSQEELKERLYTALSGRCPVQGNKFFIEDALPIKIDYTEVTGLLIKNKDKITVNNAKLIFHPYLLFNYEINRAYYNRNEQRSKIYQKSDVLIVDLLDNEVVNDPKKEFEILNNTPLKSFSIESDQRYQISKLESNYDKRLHMNIGKSNIVVKLTKGEKIPFTLRRSDVIIYSIQPVYLPRWDILFDAFGKIYKREIFACSGEEIIDTIAYCPYHTTTFGSKKTIRNTIAACEECGETFCNYHGTQCSICNKWICKNHIITCSICKKPFCKDHIRQSCSYCNDYVCSDCLVTCQTCNQIMGKDHLLICDHCGQTNCEKCMADGGVIFQKYYCKDKCDLIVKKENEKKGFFGKLINKF
jgi:HJR/Mrr/RecB family endonuclease